MRVIIAGTRTLRMSIEEIDAIVKKSGFDVVTLASGGARGIDICGEAWARSRGIYVRRFLPDWSKYGKSAGPNRNAEMALYADALIAIWDGSSPGTRNMAGNMRMMDKPVFAHNVNEQPASAQSKDKE